MGVIQPRPPRAVFKEKKEIDPDDSPTSVSRDPTDHAPHFRRVTIQRMILEQHGMPAGEALGLGETYYRLRKRFTELAPDVDLDALHRIRRAPLEVNAVKGFVF